MLWNREEQKTNSSHSLAARRKYFKRLLKNTSEHARHRKGKRIVSRRHRVHRGRIHEGTDAGNWNRLSACLRLSSVWCKWFTQSSRGQSIWETATSSVGLSPGMSEVEMRMDVAETGHWRASCAMLAIVPSLTGGFAQWCSPEDSESEGTGFELELHY